MNFKAFKAQLALLFQQCFPAPVFFGFESAEIFTHQGPFVYLDHAYFDRGYDKANFRVIWCATHQRRVLRGLPDDRMRRFCPFPRPWRQGSKVIVIPPSPNLARLHDAAAWAQESIESLRKHTDREIVVKEKSSGVLAQMLGDAWAVVSHSSVAAVEAAYLGVPVFGPETSPAFAVGEKDLSKIESPSFPDRDDWLKSLSYSQFHLDEIMDGTARGILEELWLSQP